MADITKLYPQLNELNAVLTAAGKLSEYNPDHAVTGFDHPELMSIACIGIPSRFNPWETAAFSDVDYSHHLQIIEYLSRTDASAMMMLPGASLSTRAILTLGTEQQQARFFSCFEHSPAWTFFAVTEPGVGSDATAVSCELTQNSQGWWLNGQKMLVGGAMRASAGLVFARYEQTHRLVMVFPQGKTGALQRELLDTFGLAGASLTRLTMTNLHIKEDDILGLGRRGLQQGLNALSKVFERHRPMVAAMALGTTYGLLKALETRPLPVAAKNWLAGQWRKYHALFQQMLTLAQGYHSGQQQYAQTSRLKLSATRLVEETARHLPDWLATQDWLEDTFLRKRYRDSFAFEYMEGTSNIHLLNSFRLPETRGINTMLYLDPADIVSRSFHHTEVPQPEWEEDIPHWRSYVQHFFAASGETLSAEDEQVNAWISSNERAAFSDMVAALLPDLAPVVQPQRVKTVLMAHWTPDLHMGSSVVNLAIHQLGLAHCLALAISDRGPDAGLFALDGLSDCLRGKDEDGLLLIAEQKNLMYFSPLMARLKPENNACICLVNTQQRGLRYLGYQRLTPSADLNTDILKSVAHFGLSLEQLTLIGPARCLAALPAGCTSFAVNPHLLCAAPFVALGEIFQPGRDYLLMSEHDGQISLCGLAAAEKMT